MLSPEEFQNPLTVSDIKKIAAKGKLITFFSTLKNTHIEIVDIKEDGIHLVVSMPTVVGFTESFSPATPVQIDSVLASDNLYTDLILPILAEKYEKYDKTFNVMDFYGNRRKAICVDLDDTLVLHHLDRSHYSNWDDFYADGSPNLPLIRLLTDIKKSYNPLIVIHTARPMVHLATTITQLQKHLIPYDAICHTKPRADIYIDDRSVNPVNESVEKYLERIFQ